MTNEAEENFRLNKRNFLIVGSITILYGFGWIDVGSTQNATDITISAVGFTIKAPEYTLPIILTMLCIYLGLRVVNFTYTTQRISHATTRYFSYRNEYGRIYAEKDKKKNLLSYLTRLKEDNAKTCAAIKDCTEISEPMISLDNESNGRKYFGLPETEYKFYPIINGSRFMEEKGIIPIKKTYSPSELWSIFGKSMRDLIFKEPALLDLAAPAFVAGILLTTSIYELCKIAITWAWPLGAWLIMWLAAGLT